MIITEPDGKTYPTRIRASGDGSYESFILICCKNIGTYSVYAEWRGEHIGTVTFDVIEGPKKQPTPTPTSEPVTVIPDWIKVYAGWWADEQINDSAYLQGIQYLIEEGIMVIPSTEMSESSGSQVPAWIKNNAGWWAANEITDQDFLSGIYYMIENGIIVIEIPEKGEITKEEQLVLDRNLWEFERYLDRIIKTIENDTRYIEYPNPSGDVIKKFMRDYHKWNFEQQLKMGTDSFPSPTYTENDETFLLTYKVYVNEQPKGLPLDHVSTLNNSFAYWEGRTLKAENGYDVKINFVRTESKSEANLWVTWVVRDLGEGVLGHANLGKGVVEGLLEQTGEVCLAVKQGSVDEEAEKTVVENGLVRQIGKESVRVYQAYGEFIGVARFGETGLPALHGALDWLARENLEASFTHLTRVLIERGTQVSAYEIGDVPWIDIDFPEDLRMADHIFGRIDH